MLGGFWYGEACQFNDFVGLADLSGVPGAIFRTNVLNRFQLGPAMAATVAGPGNVRERHHRRNQQRQQTVQKHRLRRYQVLDIRTDATARLRYRRFHQ